MTSNPAAQAALSELNRLIDISTLYSDYAEKFNLAECQLAIIHCAGHHDPLLVQKLWRELLTQEINSTQNLPQVRDGYSEIFLCAISSDRWKGFDFQNGFWKYDKVIKNMTMRIQGLVIIKLLNNSSGVSDEFVAEQDSPVGQHLPGCWEVLPHSVYRPAVRGHLV